MSEYNVQELTVEEIIKTGFIFKIPDYQRGYRWGVNEIKDLLSDINEIKDPERPIDVLVGKEHIEKYCLQPVVFDTVEENNNYMIVVDGQQRLTSLFLIVSFLSKVLSTNKSKIEDRLIEENIDDEIIKNLFNTFESIYKLEYVNLERESIFTNVKNNLNSINKDNIDAYYISTAYSYISSWAKSSSEGNLIRVKEDGTEQVIIPNLLKFAAKLYKSTSVIWYELDPETDGNAGDYFAKINSGKIALTNSELIKANLMLDEYCIDNTDKLFEDEQNAVLREQKKQDYLEIKKEQLSNERIKISRQWDEIEENLRNDEFWHFITDISDKYEDTRIDFLFEMVAKDKYDSIAEDGIDYNHFIELNKERATFIIIARYLKANQKQDDNIPISIKLWKEIWNNYMTFKEWFNNRELYHYIGVIIAIDKSFSAERLLKLVNNPDFKSKREVKLALLNILKYECGLAKIKDKKHEPLFDKSNLKQLTQEEYYKFLSDLDYEKQKGNIINNVLILFNVFSILNDKTKTIQAARDTFFPFGRYKSENWNLEHVHSRADGESFTKDSAQLYMEYIYKMVALITDHESNDYKTLTAGIDEYEKSYQENISNELSEGEAKADAVQKCAVIIENGFGSELDEDKLNGIGNLALLDEKTNKSYHNVPFFMKRLIISNIVNGKETEVSRFIPLCTRNIFDKSYSKLPGNTLHWTNTDCDDYSSLIKDTIYNYFKEAEKDE